MLTRESQCTYKHTVQVNWTNTIGIITDRLLIYYRCVTWAEVVAHVKCTKYTVGHVEIWVHLQFGHMAGKFQKRFGVHFSCYCLSVSVLIETGTAVIYSEILFSVNKKTLPAANRRLQLNVCRRTT